MSKGYGVSASFGSDLGVIAGRALHLIVIAADDCCVLKARRSASEQQLYDDVNGCIHLAGVATPLWIRGNEHVYKFCFPPTGLCHRAVPRGRNIDVLTQFLPPFRYSNMSSNCHAKNQKGGMVGAVA